MAEVDLGRVQGFSAYEVAKQNGYVGTEAQWLESLHGPKGDDGAPGKDGADGASAGFGTPMASVDANVGTPSVTIEASGSNAAKVFKFIFKNLKGEKGDKGERGPAGSVVIDNALSSTSTNPVQNKVVKAEFDNVNSNLVEQKMLGWTVPKECPIQNYVDSDGVFHQRVGRLDLGSLEFTVQTYFNRIITKVYVDSIKSTIPTNLPNAYTDYCRTESSNNAWFNKETIDRCLVIGSNTPPEVAIYSPPSDLSELKGHYLYYELATPITMTIDGNEVTERINESLGVIGKCKNLLKPTLQTTTQNGVTCTNNGDGTYTLNGTATQNVDFIFFGNLEKYQHLKNRTVKLVGCPKGGSLTTYLILLQLQQSPWTSAIDSGEGSSVTVDDKNNWMCWIRIYKDTTVSNLVFKPMLVYADKTPNATYDDFVPYTGDGDTLTEDVAELKNDLSNLKDGTTPAAKAVADEDGNNIKSTYAKKTEIPGGGSTAENVTVVAVPGVSQSVVNNSKCKNDRVVLDFYITVAAGTYNTIRIADITSDHGPTEVIYGTAVCTTKYSSFDKYTKPYPFQVNKAKSIYLKINETFATNMTFYISLAYDI